jgi:hypothetical protein
MASLRSGAAKSGTDIGARHLSEKPEPASLLEQPEEFQFKRRAPAHWLPKDIDPA